VLTSGTTLYRPDSNSRTYMYIRSHRNRATRELRAHMCVHTCTASAAECTPTRTRVPPTQPILITPSPGCCPACNAPDSSRWRPFHKLMQTICLPPLPPFLLPSKHTPAFTAGPCGVPAQGCTHHTPSEDAPHTPTRYTSCPTPPVYCPYFASSPFTPPDCNSCGSTHSHARPQAASHSL
jgi:hypothetical protein